MWSGRVAVLEEVAAAAETGAAAGREEAEEWKRKARHIQVGKKRTRRRSGSCRRRNSSYSSRCIRSCSRSSSCWRK
jgi:hypothetical protein